MVNLEGEMSARLIRITGVIPFRAALLGGAAVALALGASAPASAASMKERGLENRVNELEQELRNMQNRMKRVEDREYSAPERVVTSGRKQISVTLSGHVNRAMLFGFSRRYSDIHNVDNSNSSSRFIIDGRGRIDEDISVGTRIEVGTRLNQSSRTNRTNDFTGGDGLLDLRKVEFFVHHNSFGRLWMGRGDNAARGATAVDLSNTGVVGSVDVGDVAGGLFFGNPNGDFGGVLEGTNIAVPQIRNLFSPLKGQRNNRIRYDTPKFAGFMVSASYGERRVADIAIRYDNDRAGPFHIAGAVAFSHRPGPLCGRCGDPGTDNQLTGSVSILHKASGLSLTGAGGAAFARATGADTARMWYIKGGWQSATVFPRLGLTALSVDFTQQWDMAATNVTGTPGRSAAWALGFQAVQRIDSAAMEVYLGMRYHDAKLQSRRLDAVTAIMTGARIRF